MHVATWLLIFIFFWGHLLLVHWFCNFLPTTNIYIIFSPFCTIIKLLRNKILKFNIFVIGLIEYTKVSGFILIFISLEGQNVIVEEIWEPKCMFVKCFFLYFLFLEIIFLFFRIENLFGNLKLIKINKNYFHITICKENRK